MFTDQHKKMVEKFESREDMFHFIEEYGIENKMGSFHKINTAQLKRRLETNVQKMIEIRRPVSTETRECLIRVTKLVNSDICYHKKRRITWKNCFVNMKCDYKRSDDYDAIKRTAKANKFEISKHLKIMKKELKQKDIKNVKKNIQTQCTGYNYNYLPKKKIPPSLPRLPSQRIAKACRASSHIEVLQTIQDERNGPKNKKKEPTPPLKKKQTSPKEELMQEQINVLRLHVKDQDETIAELKKSKPIRTFYTPKSDDVIKRRAQANLQNKYKAKYSRQSSVKPTPPPPPPHSSSHTSISEIDVSKPPPKYLLPPPPPPCPSFPSSLPPPPELMSPGSPPLAPAAYFEQHPPPTLDLERFEVIGIDDDNEPVSVAVVRQKPKDKVPPPKTDADYDSTGWTATLDSELQEVMQNDNNTIIAHQFKLMITVKDLERLVGVHGISQSEKLHLNDNLINFYLEMITQQSNAQHHHAMYVFSVQFFIKLQDDKGYHHDSIKKWTQNSNIFDFEKLVFPIKYKGHAHWTLCIVDTRRRRIELYDSLKKPDHEQNLKSMKFIQEYLKGEHLDKLKMPLKVFTEHIMDAIPKQRENNFIDCGMYVLTYCAYNARNAKMDFSQDDMEFLRKRAVLEIARGQLISGKGNSFDQETAQNPTPSSLPSPPPLSKVLTLSEYIAYRCDSSNPPPTEACDKTGVHFLLQENYNSIPQPSPSDGVDGPQANQEPNEEAIEDDTVYMCVQPCDLVDP